MKANDTSDREIVITREFNAPRELLYNVWTDPQHVGKWWGPRGFTNTFHSMDVRPGGESRLTMHGPDGTDYPNMIRYIEVVPYERLVYAHGSGETNDPHSFSVTITFEALPGGRTRLKMYSLFKTPEALRYVVENYKAIEGGNQMLDKLGEHIALPTREGRTSYFTRLLKAPRSLVFQVWTDPKHVAQWWGPRGFTAPRCEWDARPGGAIRVDMQGPDGTIVPMRGEFREISPPERLVFVSALPDTDHTNTVEILNTVTLSESNGVTTQTLESRVIKVKPVSVQDLEGMEGGMNSSLDKLDELVASL